MPRRGALALAALIATSALPAAASAAPTDVRVAQEGLAFRVSWTADPAATDAYSVEVSGSPDFPRGIGEGCLDASPAARATALVRCLIPFPSGAWVRVAPLGPGTAAVVQVPPAAFSFSPAALPPAAPVVLRNRQVIGCAADAAEWARIDGETRFSGRIVAGGAVRASADLTSPVTGERPAFGRDALRYALTGADVGRPARCEVTASNGPLSTTRSDEAVVGHALPGEMDPVRILGELVLPRDFAFDGSARRARGQAGDARAGVLARGVLHSEGVTVFTTREVDARLAVHSTPARADAQAVRRTVCRALRRAYRAPSRGVLECRAARVGPARRAVRATTYGTAVRDDGAPVIVVQSILVASAGNSSFTLDVRVGGAFRDRVAFVREASRVTALAGARLARGAARE